MASRRKKMEQGRKLGKTTKIKNTYMDKNRKPKNQRKGKRGGLNV